MAHCSSKAGPQHGGEHAVGLREQLAEFRAAAASGQQGGPGVYCQAAQRSAKHLTSLTDWLACVGQMQLLRRQVCMQLRHHCR